ncbi:hypothetical protein QTP70_008962 [Hemibagrus guttatus]|uniref:Uncharacterized protein n=1 Tax=Hemibagrus guttatus TaxID=175788 RepID=A0AAE0Q0F8_9TELE|nr:hypothetical protein QTP70_008962 [Hemibagrus guttatus]
MGRCKDLSEFDKGQIVMARRLDQSISKTAALVGYSRSAVVSIYQKWSKEGTEAGTTSSKCPGVAGSEISGELAIVSTLTAFWAFLLLTVLLVLCAGCQGQKKATRLPGDHENLMNGFVDGAEHSTLKELCGAHTQWEENMKQADSLLCLARGHGKPFCACALCMEAEKLSCETKDFDILGTTRSPEFRDLSTHT